MCYELLLSLDDRVAERSLAECCELLQQIVMERLMHVAAVVVPCPSLQQ
jgi:hypothetical protein